MKARYILALTTGTASVVAAGMALAAPDRFTLKAPNGIAFSEFKDYATWPLIAPADPDDASGCGPTPEPGCIKAILGNPVIMKAYADGIPANGKKVPDGAVMAKLEWAKRIESAPYDVTMPGTFSAVSFMVKDSKRFPATDGWGYATFEYDAASKTWKAFGAGPAFAKTCHGCHTFVKDRDFVFTRYAER